MFPLVYRNYLAILNYWMNKCMFTAIHSSFIFLKSHVQDVLDTATDNNIKLTCDQTLKQGSSTSS